MKLSIILRLKTSIFYPANTPKNLTQHTLALLNLDPRYPIRTMQHLLSLRKLVFWSEHTVQHVHYTYNCISHNFSVYLIKYKFITNSVWPKPKVLCLRLTPPKSNWWWTHNDHTNRMNRNIDSINYWLLSYYLKLEVRPCTWIVKYFYEFVSSVSIWNKKVQNWNSREKKALRSIHYLGALNLPASWGPAKRQSCKSLVTKSMG